jgi:hypothetical protein
MSKILVKPVCVIVWNFQTEIRLYPITIAFLLFRTHAKSERIQNLCRMLNGLLAKQRGRVKIREKLNMGRIVQKECSTTANYAVHNSNILTIRSWSTST